MKKQSVKVIAPKPVTLFMKGAVAHEVYVLCPTDQNSEGMFWIKRSHCVDVKPIKGGVQLTADPSVFTRRNIPIPAPKTRKPKPQIAPVPQE